MIYKHMPLKRSCIKRNRNGSCRVLRRRRSSRPRRNRPSKRSQKRRRTSPRRQSTPMGFPGGFSNEPIYYSEPPVRPTIIVLPKVSKTVVTQTPPQTSSGGTQTPPQTSSGGTQTPPQTSSGGTQTPPPTPPPTMTTSGTDPPDDPPPPPPPVTRTAESEMMRDNSAHAAERRQYAPVPGMPNANRRAADEWLQKEYERGRVRSPDDGSFVRERQRDSVTGHFVT